MSAPTHSACAAAVARGETAAARTATKPVVCVCVCVSAGVAGVMQHCLELLFGFVRGESKASGRAEDRRQGVLAATIRQALDDAEVVLGISVRGPISPQLRRGGMVIVASNVRAPPQVPAGSAEDDAGGGGEHRCLAAQLVSVTEKIKSKHDEFRSLLGAALPQSSRHEPWP